MIACIKTEATNIASGFALCGLASTLIGFSSVTILGGLAVSSVFIRPHIKDFFYSPDINKLYPDLNSSKNFNPTKDEFESACNFLNMQPSTSNELVKRAMTIFRDGHNLENCNEKEVNHFFELEKAYRVIRNYRKNNNQWN